MQYLTHTPEESLSSHVEVLFYLHDYTPEHSVERLVPDGFVSLVIELDGRDRYIYENETLEVIQTCTGAWLSGMHDEFISISALDKTELLAIRFRPGGAYPLVGGSLLEFRNRVVPADECLPGVLRLRERLLEEDDPEGKLDLAADWLTGQIEAGPELTPAILESCRKITEEPTVTHISEVVAQSGYSRKQFIQLFKKEIGLTPKVFQRILKFNRILQRIGKEEMINWSEISESCGYYDQSHFIRDFKEFSGFIPTDFLDESFDRENFFPVD